MSTHVTAFKPINERWRQMKAIHEACVAAEVEIPDEVERFFDWGTPSDSGVRISEDALSASGAVREWSDDRDNDGFEVDITKLPADVTVIRFYNSW